MLSNLNLLSAQSMKCAPAWKNVDGANKIVQPRPGSTAKVLAIFSSGLPVPESPDALDN